eukprot:13183219-Alexandrium_andersonii.AAC.1
MLAGRLDGTDLNRTSGGTESLSTPNEGTGHQPSVDSVPSLDLGRRAEQFRMDLDDAEEED